jgi:hypothetical protein
VTIDDSSFRALEPLPRCKHCDSLARPNVLMFGDWSWLRHRTDAQQERFCGWLDQLAKPSAKLVFIERGAGSAVPTVRHMSERVVERFGGTLLRVNPREPEVLSGHVGLALGAAKALRSMIHLL